MCSTMRFYTVVSIIVSMVRCNEVSKTVSPNVTHLEKRLQKLEDTVSNLAEKLQNVTKIEHTHGSSATGASSVYVRWGKKTCPSNGTEMVYWGYVAGSWFGHSGAAANRLCMSSEPKWNPGIGQGGGAFLHGAEYEETFSSKAKLDFDVPCAVCRVTTRASVLMVPGRNVCYPGWSLEYNGVLTAGHHTHAGASEHLCLDADAEAVNHSDDGDNGALFYHVNAQCTSLPCPPYVQNTRISCSVCSI